MKPSELRQIIKEELSKILNEGKNQLSQYAKGQPGYYGYKLSKAQNPDEILKNIKYIDGYLDLSRSNIKILPDNLEVEGWVSLSNTKIENLPNGFKVKGDLDILNNKYIKSFPKDLIVGGNLVLNSKNFNKAELKKLLPNVTDIIIMEP
jgi:hypothetical protein